MTELEILKEKYPFHLIIGKDLSSISLGRAYEKMGNKNEIKFEVTNAIQRQINLNIKAQTIKIFNLELHGNIYKLEHSEYILLLKLKLNNIKIINEEELHLEYFAEDDPILDYLFVFQAQQKAIEQMQTMNDDLKKAEKKAKNLAITKSSFLANISHEIRNPLNGIIGTLSLLDENHYNKELLNMLITSSRNLKTIVDDILESSAMEYNKFHLKEEVFNLYKYLNSNIKLFENSCSKKKIEYSFTIDDSLNFSIQSDSTRIGQVINNIISNAIKFTPPNGKIKIECKHDKKNNYLKISIKDSGIGIDDSKREIIYNKFTQSDETITKEFQGTGLGLSISKTIAQKLNGRLYHKSKIGKGTEFFFDIPIIIAKKPIKSQEKILNKKLSSKNILVCDDNPINRKILRKFLERYQCNIHEAENGEEATEIFKKTDIDISLIDLQMPVMDGYSFLESVLPIKRDKKIIAISGYCTDKDITKSITLGFDDHIAKPINFSSLKKIIEQ